MTGPVREGLSQHISCKESITPASGHANGTWRDQHTAPANFDKASILSLTLSASAVSLVAARLIRHGGQCAFSGAGLALRRSWGNEGRFEAEVGCG